jgi:putative magnesium chelatase accessory protein
MSRADRLAYRRTARERAAGRLVWDVDGADWPNRTFSRFVRAGGLNWHVQVMGNGPVILLIHGTGASTHSWRALAPLLADRFTVIAPDLPGHGFTETPRAEGFSLPGMAAGLSLLLEALGASPVIAAGHSAGAAILARMCLDGRIAPSALISLNGAFLPLRGPSVALFSPLAKVLTAIKPLPRLVARVAANQGAVERLLADTGSRLEPAGISQYRLLFSNPGHVAATLGMMANWRLEILAREIGGLKPALTLIVGGNDGTISPADAGRVQALVSGATIVGLPGLGHLAHEEQPKRVAELIRGAAKPTANNA